MGIRRRTLACGLHLALALLFAAVGAQGAGAAESPRQLSLREKVVALDLAGAWPPADAPPGLASTFRLAAGDVFGEKRDALAVLYRLPGDSGHHLSVYRLQTAAGAGTAAIRGLAVAAQADVPDLLADGLVAADVTGNGRAELWLGHSPSVGCLEWDGERLVPLQPWKFWQNKPVTAGRLGGGAGAPDQILAFGAWYSPEMGVGLISAWWRDKMWGKAFDLRGSEFFCPGDRVAAADVDGDGAPELLLAASPRRSVLPRQPFTVAALREEKVIASLDGLFPEAMAVADLSGDGVPEIYFAENLPGSEGQASGGRVTGFEWNGRRLQEVFRRDFPQPVADLTAGDFAGDGRPSLVVGLIRPEKETARLTLAILRLRGEDDLGW